MRNSVPLALGLSLAAMMSEGCEKPKFQEKPVLITRDAGVPEEIPAAIPPQPILEFTKLGPNEYEIGDGKSPLKPGGKEFFALTGAARIYVKIDNGPEQIAEWDVKSGRYLLLDQNEESCTPNPEKPLQFLNGKRYRIQFFPDESEIFGVLAQINTASRACANIFKNGRLTKDEARVTEPDGDFESCFATDTTGKKGVKNSETKFSYIRVENAQVVNRVTSRISGGTIKQPEACGGKAGLLQMEAILGPNYDHGAFWISTTYTSAACGTKEHNIGAGLITGRNGEKYESRPMQGGGGPEFVSRQMVDTHKAVKRVLEAQNARRSGTRGK